MELLFPHPRIFDHFPSRIANDPPLILAVLVRNSACINILKSCHQIFLAQAIENTPSIPHICLKTRLQGQILVFPYRSNKKALKADLDRQNVASFQAYIVIVETLDDEINAGNVGRNADELFRRLQACQFVAEHGDQVCPAKWQPGAETLKPSLDLVGML